MAFLIIDIGVFIVGAADGADATLMFNAVAFLVGCCRFGVIIRMVTFLTIGEGKGHSPGISLFVIAKPEGVERYAVASFLLGIAAILIGEAADFRLADNAGILVSITVVIFFAGPPRLDVFFVHIATGQVEIIRRPFAAGAAI